ncbi:ABC transporter ATP-binding protein [Thermosyntropha sp.]|uniref:ABC transporter ATP-binding protein n=1 Tax=Thermosyntropha sp. TaxID=2740820 RepID=UPI0025D4A52B|nr:ABC transporter ATP-binding protein [Thermosyntropha sp.]MBO8159871.1 ATP-binding cassette domain-containing protein [Thermosyntropha sp.]
MAKIKISSLTYTYPEKEEPALKDIDLEIKEGEFVLLIGENGSGKSSLLRAIAGIIPDFYRGDYKGEVYIDNLKVRKMKPKEKAGKIGFLGQDPESQIFMTKVEKELVFGMENILLPLPVMRRRVAETAAFLNLGEYIHESVDKLSGGMKQRLALAAVMAMQPEVLLLDEPTSQLDPASAEEIFNILKRLNEENGITVVLAEQRLERCLHLADRIIVMDEGKISYISSDKNEWGAWMAENKAFLLPPLLKLFSRLPFEKIPFTVKEGRSLIADLPIKCVFLKEMGIRGKNACSPVLEMDKVWFTYSGGREVLKNISLKVFPGEFWAVFGENGAGKTTLLKNIAGLLKPQRGRICIKGENIQFMKASEIARKAGYLPQNPDDYLFLPTVEEEILFSLENTENKEEKTSQLIEKFNLEPYAAVNPRDLSMGERQKTALASILALNPDLLLLDEPTRGLDYLAKEDLGKCLKMLCRESKSILMVSHDIEFAAEYADKVLIMFEGEIAAAGSKYEIMNNALFYSPQINRLLSGRVDRVVTLEEGDKVIRAFLEDKEEKKFSGG